MVLTTVFLLLLTLGFFFLSSRHPVPWLRSTAIALLTFFYHFSMRLAVGEAVTLLFRHQSFPLDRLGFPLHAFEAELYKKLKVKQWKTGTLTAKPEQFDLNLVSPEELLHNILQAELVHRVIMVLSFVPLLFILPFGAPVVFVITSVLACLIDLQFVIIQRYNRPRVQRYIALANKRNARKSG